MQTTIGIDPGITGAIAAIHDGKVVGLKDMPVHARLHGKGNQVDVAALSSIIMEIKACKSNVVAVLEVVSARPGQGVTSMFHFGDSVGAVRGVLGALQIPCFGATPQKWKRAAGIMNKDKDAARALSITTHPEVSHELTRKKDIGRADAILIAEFGL